MTPVYGLIDQTGLDLQMTSDGWLWTLGYFAAASSARAPRRVCSMA